VIVLKSTQSCTYQGKPAIACAQSDQVSGTINTVYIFQKSSSSIQWAELVKKIVSNILTMLWGCMVPLMALGFVIQVLTRLGLDWGHVFQGVYVVLVTLMSWLTTAVATAATNLD
jgi:hypothetical protein